MKGNIMQTYLIANVELAYPKLAEALENKFGAKQFDVRIDFPENRVNEMSAFSRSSPRPGDTDGMFSINVKANELNAKGQSNKPRVVDVNKQPLSEEMIRNMGNGTKANVLVLQYRSKRDGKMTTILKAIQVLEYKKYEMESLDFDIVGNTTKDTQEFTNQF